VTVNRTPEVFHMQDHTWRDQSPGKAGKVREFQSGQENWKKSGKSWGNWDRLPVLYCVTFIQCNFYFENIFIFLLSWCHSVCHSAAVH